MTESRRLPQVAMEALMLITLHQLLTHANGKWRKSVACLSQTTMDLLLERAAR